MSTRDERQISQREVHTRYGSQRLSRAAVDGYRCSQDMGQEAYGRRKARRLSCARGWVAGFKKLFSVLESGG